MVIFDSNATLELYHKERSASFPLGQPPFEFGPWFYRVRIIKPETSPYDFQSMFTLDTLAHEVAKRGVLPGTMQKCVPQYKSGIERRYDEVLMMVTLTQYSILDDEDLAQLALKLEKMSCNPAMRGLHLIHRAVPEPVSSSD